MSLLSVGNVIIGLNNIRSIVYHLDYTYKNKSIGSAIKVVWNSNCLDEFDDRYSVYKISLDEWENRRILCLMLMQTYMAKANQADTSKDSEYQHALLRNGLTNDIVSL